MDLARWSSGGGGWGDLAVKTNEIPWWRRDGGGVEVGGSGSQVDLAVVVDPILGYFRTDFSGDWDVFTGGTAC